MKPHTYRFAAMRHFFAMLTLFGGVALLSACSNEETPETINLKGQLTYSQNAPLPKKGHARISLIQHAEPQANDGTEPPAPTEADNSGRRIVAEQTLHNLDTKPIRFDLKISQALLDDTGRYVLKAQINNAEGQAQWRTAVPVPIKPNQADQKIELVLVPTPENFAVLSFTHFACKDGFTFAAASDSERAVLRLGGDRTITLPSVRSASGAKYSADQTLYWTKGSEALIQVEDQKHSHCLRETTKATEEKAAPKDAPKKAPEETQDPAQQTEAQAPQSS